MRSGGSGSAGRPLAVAWLLMCTPAPAAPPAPPPTPTTQAALAGAPMSMEERATIPGLISFISERDGNREVYLIAPTSRGERRLTRLPGADYNGPATPDGSQLLITSVSAEETGPLAGQQFHLVALDPKVPARLRAIGSRRSFLKDPSFSADGKSLIFASQQGGFSDLFSLRLADGKTKQLTNNPEGNFAPTVAKTRAGDQVLFISSRDRVAELYQMPLQGGPAQRLTQTTRDELTPVYFPDGSWMAFGSDREGADRIFLQPVPKTPSDKSQPAHRLTALGPNPTYVEEKPLFSPSLTDRRLIYQARRPGAPRVLFVVELDASMHMKRQTVLVGPGNQPASEPTFSPDGRYVAFTVAEESRSQLYLCRADGSGMVKLTTQPGPNWHPLWVPPPTR